MTGRSRKARTARQLPAVTRLAVSLALASYALAVLINAHHVAWWSLPLAGGVCLWRARATWSTHQLPARGTRVLLVIVLTVAVLLSFRTLNGLAAGSTLMTAMGAAKLMEARTRRDWYISLVTAVFLLLAACLDAQALWRLPLYLLLLWLMATTLQALGSGSTTLGARQYAWRAARGLLYASPVAVLLFLFFPRLPGAFWALPENGMAVTGLGDDMSPGSISELSESDEQAMRVRFDSAPPPPEERYWRGPVLHDFDGYTWRRLPGEFTLRPALRYAGNTYAYQVTLEPAHHDVLLALDMPEAPAELLRGPRQSYDYQLFSREPPNSRRSYQLVSHTAYYSTDTLGVMARRIDLRLPPERNPRSRALAQSLRASVDSDRSFVTAVLEYFGKSGFEYTLTPPRLDYDSVDDFLFNTRRGFCGHYASAFVMLMRAGGVPARVVTGYLGGEWNSYGEYLVVRQSYAHAWAEVWLQGRGWTRVDPTAVIAPERLRRGVFDLLPGLVRDRNRSLRQLPLLGEIYAGADALNAWWQDKVVGFDFRRQLALLDAIGLDESRWQTLVWLLGGGGTLWVAWLSWQMRDRLRPLHRNALQRLWSRYERQLGGRGLQRAGHEGPLAFTQRAALAMPAHAEQLLGFARHYARLRYGPVAPPWELTALRRRLTALQLRNAK